MIITVRFDDGMLRFASRLANGAEQVPRALREGLKEGGDLVRTQVRKSLRHQMNTKTAGVITEHTTGTLAAGGALEYLIKGTGKGLPIKFFPVRGSGRARHANWRDQPRNSLGQFGRLRSNEAGKVTAEPWGPTHRFKRSYRRVDGEFVAQLPGTRRVRRLFGPGVAKEIVKDETAGTFEATAASTVDRIIIRRLGRLF